MDTNFIKFTKIMGKHLQIPKHFTINGERLADVDQAVAVAHKLFGDMQIALQDDPLETGSLVLCIKGFDVVVRGKHEIELFTALISKADNFEIYATKGNNVEFNIMFNKVLIAE